MHVSPAVLGVLRSVGFIVVMAVVHFATVAANLSPVVGDSLAGLIATIALAFEHSQEAKTGKAVFGAVTLRP